MSTSKFLLQLSDLVQLGEDGVDEPVGLLCRVHLKVLVSEQAGKPAAIIINKREQVVRRKKM